MGGKVVDDDGREIGNSLGHFVTRLEEAALMHVLMDRLGVNEIRVSQVELMTAAKRSMTRRDEVSNGDIVFTR